MKTISPIIQSVKPGEFMSKLDIEDAYSVQISEPDQQYLTFQFDGFLCKYSALPNGFTKDPRKFTKLLKPILSELERVEKVGIAGYFDDLITINSFYISCLTNVA